MEINGNISLLVGGDSTTIEISDSDSGITFVRVVLSPEQLSSALSRLAMTETESCKVYGLQKIGKKQENKSILIPTKEENQYSVKKDKNLDIIIDDYVNENFQGWEADHYYNSQNSFQTKDNIVYVKQTIRRWV